MYKLLKLEYQKLRSTNYFKVLSILWLVAFLAIPITFQSIMSALVGDIGAANDDLINPGNWPIFDFVDLWQNLTYVYKAITIFLCLNLVISTANEFSHKTIRQNVIDGLSKKEFWLSKISFILVSCIVATLLLLIFGLLIGFWLSPVKEFSFIIENIEFVGAYFLHLVHFLSFAFFVTVLLRRAGFSIALILFYVYILEPIISALLYYNYNMEFLANALPLESGWSLINRPIHKYLFQETIDYVPWESVLMSSFWIFVFLWGSYKLITKRDL